MVVKMNCNSLENICGCIVVLCIAQGHYHYFTGIVLQLLINLRKPQNFSTSNDLQCTVFNYVSLYKLKGIGMDLCLAQIINFIEVDPSYFWQRSELAVVKLIICCQLTGTL